MRTHTHTDTHERMCATEQIQLQQVRVAVRGYFLLEETLIHDKSSTQHGKHSYYIYAHVCVCVFVCMLYGFIRTQFDQ